MAGNFLKYAATLTANDLPVDSHELIALCAPRPVFIGGGATLGTSLVGDSWADVPGSFKGAVAAGPVYRLLGKKDLGTAAMPLPETALIDGDIGFRQHTSGHTPIPNWPAFLTFAGHYSRWIESLSLTHCRLARPGTGKTDDLQVTIEQGLILGTSEAERPILEERVHKIWPRTAIHETGREYLKAVCVV